MAVRDIFRLMGRILREENGKKKIIAVGAELEPRHKCWMFRKSSRKQSSAYHHRGAVMEGQSRKEGFSQLLTRPNPAKLPRSDEIGRVQDGMVIDKMSDS